MCYFAGNKAELSMSEVIKLLAKPDSTFKYI